MKKIIFFILVAIAMQSTAQITLEHVYDSASAFASGSPALEDELMLVNFEVSGYEYVKISRHGQTIKIYDLSHNLLKTIDWSGFPYATSAGNYASFLYFSQKLFDTTDTEIKFMYAVNGASGIYTGIYKEDGTLIFADTGAPEIIPNWAEQQYPIYNTPNGTKMILSYKNNSHPSMLAKVFSVAGTLTTAAQMTGPRPNGNFSNLYPNPGHGDVTLQYQLPPGVQSGQIILYDMEGNQLKTYMVDDTFTSLLLNNSQLPAGTYFYQLSTANGLIGTKKMVVVK